MSSNGLESIPWRGPGPGRPEGLALPPDRLPLRRNGVWRKRWRYAAVFAEEAFVCAARVQVGPMGQTFWLICERGGGQTLEHTRLRPPGARGEVWSEALDREGLRDHAPDSGALVRIEGSHPEAGPVRGFLRFHGGSWAESVCPAKPENYVWTRKRAAERVEADVRIGERRLRFQGRGIEDESEGYHPHHTVWSWSAGVGRTADGRAIGWNLVQGVNDPPEGSERAIWADGELSEPGPVEFDDLEAIRFADGARLEFSAECERRRSESKLGVSYQYVQPMGSFSGTLPGGLELVEGLGVMEYQDARW